MTLRLLSHIELPAHRSKGGFDHADVHSPSPTDRLYVVIVLSGIGLRIAVAGLRRGRSGPFATLCGSS